MATLRRRHFATLWRRFGDAWRRLATLGDAWRRLATLRAIGDARRRAATLWRQFGDSLATLWRRLATLGDAWSNLNNTGRERWLRKAAARSGRASIRPRVDPSKVAVATNLQLPPGSCKTAGLQALAKHYVVMAVSLSGCLIITVVLDSARLVRREGRESLTDDGGRRFNEWLSCRPVLRL